MFQWIILIQRKNIWSGFQHNNWSEQKTGFPLTSKEGRTNFHVSMVYDVKTFSRNICGWQRKGCVRVQIENKGGTRSHNQKEVQTTLTLIVLIVDNIPYERWNISQHHSSNTESNGNIIGNLSIEWAGVKKLNGTENLGVHSNVAYSTFDKVKQLRMYVCLACFQ